MEFIKGLGFGMVLQLSIGPVCIAVLHRSIIRGFFDTFKMILAVALVDGVYIVLSFAGISGFLSIEPIRKAVLITGAGVLIYFGVKHLIKHSCNGINSTNTGSSFLYGIKLTLTNPLTIVFWSGAFGSLIASGRLEGMIEVAAFSAGCIASTVLFLSVVSAGAVRISGAMGIKPLRYLDFAVGLFLIGFGIYMVIK